MKNNLELLAAAPAAFTPAERIAFVDLVLAAGEVGGDVLAANVAKAKALIWLKRGAEVVGVAALKRPQSGYRQRIANKAKADLAEASFPYELGYVYVLPPGQGKKLSHRLVAEALARADGAGIFATARVDNAPMLAALTRAGFEVVGQPYPGREKRKIQLLIRPRANPAT